MEWIFSVEELPAVATSFWATFTGSHVFTLEGQMGAGKTTLVNALCTARGVLDTTASPTYAIINQYHFEDTAGQEQLIYHLDLYRLRDEEEAIAAGVEDCLYEGATCFVEWPDIVLRILPPGSVRLQLEVLPDQKRRLTAGVPSDK
ncbi:tRNA (adenosine(37)-N6)-threonylcarbamoyltransferase complex ATPase subunit type 1 TsaE [Chitinophaga pendula]|uniref:tRNA (adenosine(37)-N6)-threonylcarbamoyltransferase complex ATPase subunit type 1 TsaE n=1 Tax=Chitinophaga TaxID=79328 RepID=UPI000BAE6C8D|nr:MULTISPECIES: tRNA (adenosine(37)-N6)-threonylcarbamoyltransferase complex ATPase subunit type 1 TsaE [Chitinophaga]ASZ10892.1 tRNA (adenosine(37)-N6)-threonylcarbamoyltransferase complex ATPase subunit type 1 TsaE [Chitinophaga sp. MD30]UCJ06125.1 tRNA (adenosine(37)-N6)-threonylcarbamoyltransferase complex ATPase subunit type 1 TsaE [Chitinophaga pendula]